MILERCRELRAWFFEDRERTVKYYADMVGEDVRIHDLTTSPVKVAGAWVFGAPFWLLLAGMWWLVFNPPEAGHEYLWAVVVGFPALIYTIGVVGVTRFHVKRWWGRVFSAPPLCEFCGSPTRYPHEFRHHHDIGQTRTLPFCSADCRERWERDEIDYSFSGYYDIQAEDDEDRVKLKNHSSAWEVSEA